MRIKKLKSKHVVSAAKGNNFQPKLRRFLDYGVNWPLGIIAFEKSLSEPIIKVVQLYLVRS